MEAETKAQTSQHVDAHLSRWSLPSVAVHRHGQALAPGLLQLRVLGFGSGGPRRYGREPTSAS